MNNKKLLIVTAGLAILAGLLVLTKRSDSGELPDAAALVGKPLLDPEIMEQTARIRIYGTLYDYVYDPEDPNAEPDKIRHDLETNLTLDQKGRWVQTEYFSMPASEDRMKEVFDGYMNGKLIRYITSDPTETEILELGSQNYEFYDSDGKLLKKIELADIGDFYYYYVRYDNLPAIYMANHDSFFDPGPDNWRDKLIFNILEDSIQSVRLRYPTTNVELNFERDDAESDWQSPEQPEGRFLWTEKVDRGLRKITSSNFVNALPKDLDTVANARVNAALIVTLTSFSGETYTYEIGLIPTEITTPSLDAGASAAGSDDRAIVFMSASSSEHPIHEWGTDLAFSFTKKAVYEEWPKSIDDAFLAPVELEEARFVDSPDFGLPSEN